MAAVVLAVGAGPASAGLLTIAPGFTPWFLDTPDSNLKTGDVVWLFLDDGNTSDDNHDDTLVRITATIPEPRCCCSVPACSAWPARPVVVARSLALAAERTPGWGYPGRAFPRFAGRGPSHPVPPPCR